MRILPEDVDGHAFDFGVVARLIMDEIGRKSGRTARVGYNHFFRKHKKLSTNYGPPTRQHLRTGENTS